MKKFFFLLVITFGILFVVNIAWITLNLYSWATVGIDIVLSGSDTERLFENIYYSLYFKWIILVDVLWLISLIIFMLQRKHFKTDPTQHFLKYDPIDSPKICVTIPAYNEQDSIEQTVKDFIKHRYVESVIVVDNKSTDDTALLAEKCGAKVIRQDKNRGFAHSYATGLKEALKTDTNIIATAEADGTNNVYDLDKMIPYLSKSGAIVSYYDPTGEKKEFFKLSNCKFKNNLSDVCKNADLVILHTEWDEFKSLDFNRLVKNTKFKVYDLRNLYNFDEMFNKKIKYYSIGRPNIN